MTSIHVCSLHFWVEVFGSIQGGAQHHSLGVNLGVLLRPAEEVVSVREDLLEVSKCRSGGSLRMPTGGATRCNKHVWKYKQVKPLTST